MSTFFIEKKKSVLVQIPLRLLSPSPNVISAGSSFFDMASSPPFLKNSPPFFQKKIGIATWITRNKKASEALQPDEYLEPKWLRCLDTLSLDDFRIFSDQNNASSQPQRTRTSNTPNRPERTNIPTCPTKPVRGESTYRRARNCLPHATKMTYLYNYVIFVASQQPAQEPQQLVPESRHTDVFIAPQR